MRMEGSDLSRDCRDARDAGIDLGFWSPVRGPEQDY